MDQRKSAAAFVASLCIYGTIGWALAFIDLPSEVVVLCRGAIGTVFILVVLFATKRGFDRESVRANLGWLAGAGISLGLNWVLLFAAYRATTVAVASLLNYMAPVILIIIAPFVLGERRSAKKAACATAAVVGMVGRRWARVLRNPICAPTSREASVEGRALARSYDGRRGDSNGGTRGTRLYDGCRDGFFSCF